MRIPHLVVNRRHHVAVLTVSFGRRIWDSRQVGPLILGYNASGRLCRVVFLDITKTLNPSSSPATAAREAAHVLARVGGMAREIAVLRSARLRAEAQDKARPGLERSA